MTRDWNACDYPWYKRFARDFLSSPTVAMMSPAQRGIYSVLLDRAWVEDGLPIDRRQLAVYALCTPDELEEAWTFPLDQAWEEVDGRLRNPRQEAEREEAIRLREARSRGGRKTARSQPEDSSKSPAAVPEDSTLYTEAEAEAELTPTPSEKGLPSLGPGGEVFDLLADLCPRGRLARGDASRRASWAIAWNEGGHPFEIGKRATARYRRSADKPDLFPQPEALLEQAELAISETAAGIVPLDRAITMARSDPDGQTAQSITAAGLDWQARDFSTFGRNDETWRRHQAIAAICRAEAEA